MKRLWALLLLLTFLLTGCFGKKAEEEVQGKFTLNSQESISLGGFSITNLQDDLIEITASEEEHGLALVKEANSQQGAVDMGIVSLTKEDYVNKDLVSNLTSKGLITLAFNEKVKVVNNETTIKFASEYQGVYEGKSTFNMVEVEDGYEVVAGVYGQNSLYGKGALYVNDKLAAVVEVPVINGVGATLKFAFNTNEPPHKVQVVFANNDGEGVKFLGTKAYSINENVNKNVIMKNVTGSTFSFPQKLVKDSTGITYKPAIEVSTWNSYTTDDMVKIGGVVYWTTQNILDKWAIYSNENLVYEGPVTRAGSGMNMHYGDVNLPQGLNNIQVVFASDVDGQIKYGISDAKALNIALGNAKPASLKVNVAPSTFTANFVPEITVNGVTKAVNFGQSITFDNLVSGNTYSVLSSTFTEGNKSYVGLADKNQVVVSDATIEEVTVTYSEKIVETGSVTVTLANPTFATTIFTPQITINGELVPFNWGETKTLTKVVGEVVEVKGATFANTTNEYTATVNPVSVIVDKLTTKAVTVSYTESTLNLPSARPWEAKYVYTQGDRVYYNGNIYEATGWAQGKTPDTAAEWKLIGPGVEDKGFIWKGTTARPVELDKKKIVMYFPEWGIYGGHNQYYPHLMPLDKLTHVFYAFATIKDGKIAHFDTDAAINQSMGGHTDWGGKDSGNLGQLRLLQKQYPQVSFLVSVGGWSQSANFPLISDTAAERKIFADSVVAYLREWKLDGVDIDWEFPGVPREPDIKDNPNDQGNPYAKPEDKQNFTLLLKDLRAALNKAGEEDGRYYQLATAVNASAGKVQFTEPAEYSKYVDFINLMTYDLHGAWDPITGHHSALSKNPGDPHTGLSVAECLENFLGLGIPKEKLVIGSPFYSRGWKEVKNDGPYPDTYPGLFASANGGAKGIWDGGVAAGNNPYYHLLEMERDPRFVKYRDPYNNSPYLYSAELGEFYTYEDKISLQDKVDYVNQNQYGGIIVWEITGDSPARGGTELLDVIYNGFKTDLATMDFNLK